MTTNTNRISTHTSTSVGPEDGEKKKDMWSSMLDNVASGKRLPEKNMLVLGGILELQQSRGLY
jgi:dynein light intermediate chain 1